MRRIFFYTTLLFILIALYPQVSFAEKKKPNIYGLQDESFRRSK